MTMKTILVTGASGFIGSHLIGVLRKNFKVRIIRGTDLHSFKKIKNATLGVSGVIHLAAIKYNLANLGELRKVNVQYTQNLLKFAGNTHFIYISTWLAAYHEKTGFYGQTKKEAEDEVKKSGKNFTILRLPHIYSTSKTSLIFTKYILPAYLKFRYNIKPLYPPANVSQIVQAIKKVITQKRFYKKSFYVTGEKTFISFT